jgi:4-hydroxy-3-methylbut-2-en-1-yl diphosphate synthase IspG/GcpE
MQTNQQPTATMTIDPSTAEVIECPDCHGTLWDTLTEIRRVSPLVSPTGKETYLQVPVVVCAVTSCSHKLNTALGNDE